MTLGGHEGGETPFVLDASKAIRPGQRNRLAVRVLNPTHQAIDGIVLNETPHRNKVIPYGPGSAWDQGGIMDSVELLVTPPVRIADLFVRPDWKTGRHRRPGHVDNAAPDMRGSPTWSSPSPRRPRARPWPSPTRPHAAAGRHVVRDATPPRQPEALGSERSLPVPRHGADQPDRVPGCLTSSRVRCGFRDFRFENGAFRLNGRRIYLRCSHTGNCCPIGLELPHDPDFLRRDLINAKAMRFNAIRFISGVAKRYQLDLATRSA